MDQIQALQENVPQCCNQIPNVTFNTSTKEYTIKCNVCGRSIKSISPTYVFMHWCMNTNKKEKA